MSTPKVSILIPAYNAAPWIEDTLRSALAQTWPAVEIIVVDDGSADDTLEIARRYEHSGVKVISQPNRGASAARNTAFAAATGDYIQYLDADDLLAPDKIELQMALLVSQPPQVISSSSWGMFMGDRATAQLSPTALWADYQNPVDWLIAAWTGAGWMQPTAWLTHRSLIEAAGPWDERLSLHDDGEFFSRVLLQSSGIRFCAGAKSYYRKGIGTSLSSIRSPKAVASHYRICERYEAHLRDREDSDRTREACAANYQQFIYEYYPEYPAMTRQAAEAVKRLGGSSALPGGSPLFKQLSRILGWKNARRLEKFAYRNKLTPSSLMKRFKFKSN